MMKSRNEQISDLFRELAGTLHGVVRRNAKGVADATIEDACAFAWTQLVERPHVLLDDEHMVLNWLVKVATREAWHSSRQQVRVQPSETIADRVDAISTAPENVEQTVLGRDRLRALTAPTGRQGLPALTERQRQMLFLLATGHTYAEISEITGATLRTVDRQLRRAVERAREHDPERT